MLEVIDNPTPEQTVEILLRSVALADESIAIRLSRPLGPSRFVQMSMVAGAIVHALWPDEAAPGGYAHRIVSGQAHAEGTYIEDRSAFLVPDEESAEVLARTFGDGREPAADESWCIALLIRDPDGGRDEHGKPELVLIIDQRNCV